MTLFQLVLFLISAALFYMFFRQLFSGSYPRRGVDFDSSLPPERIGSVTNPGQIFAKPATAPNRLDELISIADKAASEGDWLEVKKAMQSALILDKDNTELMHRLGTAYLHMEDALHAKEIYNSILRLRPDDDLAEVSLANALHKLGVDDEALHHHERAVAIDPQYAPHYYNYANTLYDMGDRERALELYHKALQKDPQMDVARDAIKELEQ